MILFIQLFIKLIGLLIIALTLLVLQPIIAVLPNHVQLEVYAIYGYLLEEVKKVREETEKYEKTRKRDR